MDIANHIIILGSGHLAFQVKRQLRAKNYQVVHISPERFEEMGKDDPEHSELEHFKDVLREAGVDRARAVYVLDDEDRNNIQFALVAISLNETIPVIVSLFNEDLAPHLRATHKNLSVRNPGLIAAPFFVDALRARLERKVRAVSTTTIGIPEKKFSEIRANLGLYGLVAGFVGFLLGGTAFFHWSEKLSWLDAFYFTTTVITTTGFGDINLRYSSAGAKIFGISMMLSAITLASITLSFIVDRLLKRRAETALGRRRYAFENHVILCGLGRLGYQIAEELLRRGEKVLIIESNPENRFVEIVRSRGAKVFVGDAALPKNLRDAGVEKAAGVFSVIRDDLKNLEIGMSARALRPDLRLILRIFDKEIAEEVKNRLDIHFALSASAIAAEQFMELLTPRTTFNILVQQKGIKDF